MNTIPSARKTLNRAYVEVHQAYRVKRNKVDIEKVRQAAEKGWRAAREAVYAVFAAMGQRVKGTVSPAMVMKFEVQNLGRDRSEGQPLADGYSNAIAILHGDCFYDGTCPNEDSMYLALDRVEVLIDQAEDDIARFARR